MLLRACVVSILLAVTALGANGKRSLDAARQAESRGDVAGATEKYTEALAAYEQSDDHPGMFMSLDALGRLASRGNDLQRAEQYYRKELEIQRHPHMSPMAQLEPLLQLGALYPRMRRWTDAAAAFEQIAQIWADNIDGQSPGYGRYLGEAASQFEMGGDHRKAEEKFRQGLAVYDRAGIQHTPAGWDLMERFARCLMAEAKPVDAEPLLKESAAGFDRIMGRNTISDNTAGEYARLLRSLNRIDEAQAFEKSRPPARAIFNVGRGVSQPQPTRRREPGYTEEARRKRVTGDIVVYLEISEQGVAENVQVLRPLGFGLDQNAIDAVGTWRFQPALKDGTPVRVSAQVDVNFRLL